jgi:Protein of unknown function (DUF1018)
MKTVAAIHVAKKQLGLDDDTYRAVLVRVTGKDSCSAMSGTEQQRVIEHFRQQGFKPTEGRKRLSGPFAAKLQALWIGAWNLGLVKNREDAAMLAFVKRQTGIDHVRFLTNAKDAAKAVEGLKAWMARDGGVVWSERVGPSGYIYPNTHLSGFQIALAQFSFLNPGFGWRVQISLLAREVLLFCEKTALDMKTEADWVPVMNAFGARVRAAKAAAK